jgi:DNA polymerase III gamma/tau subunit
LEQVAIVGEVNIENTAKFLGIAPERQIQVFLEKIEQNNINELFEEIENLQKQ